MTSSDNHAAGKAAEKLQTPHVQVLRGKPSAEQLAAVVAALRVVLARSSEDAAQPRSFWGMPQMRSTLPHGRGMWTHSLRNR